MCWIGPDGTPSALAATPLLLGSAPCVALPYARADEIAGLRTAGTATFAVTDSRSLPPGEAGLARTGRVRVHDDVTGELFAAELLEQELRKYPPSRTLADSPLLRRENWWWLPRVIVSLDGPADPGLVRRPLARTNPARHALLAEARPDGLALRSVAVGDDAGADATVVLRDLAGEAGPAEPTPALAIGYDYAIPDLERWETWSLAGTTHGNTLTVTQRSGNPGAELTALTLLERTRRHAALSRACRRTIRTFERLR
ncbi:hypothetical protein ACFSVJ_05525 [Prauserella oleivorans]